MLFSEPLLSPTCDADVLFDQSHQTDFQTLQHILNVDTSGNIHYLLPMEGPTLAQTASTNDIQDIQTSIDNEIAAFLISSLHISSLIVAKVCNNIKSNFLHSHIVTKYIM